MAPLRILYVEDDPASRTMLTIALEAQGHHVTPVEDANRALSSLNSLVFDVVLMDLHLPDMDGIEATKVISRLTKLPKPLPVIAVTADRTRQTMTLCSSAGINAIILKPVSLPALQAELSKIRRAA